MSEPAVELRGVSKVYPGTVPVRALDNVDLRVEKGEFVAVMGPSGSGKSTLLHVVGCMDRPTSGTVLVDGIDVAGLGDRELARIRAEKVGFVFQFFNLIPTLNCLENVELPMHILGRLGGADIRARAVRLLQMVGLGERMSHRPAQLSGGERQRVAIARALANMPTLMLADEPTGNLDTQTGLEIVEMLREINEATGQTVIVVTHDPVVAEGAGKVVEMVDGRVVTGDARRGHIAESRGSLHRELEVLRREVMMLELLKEAMHPGEYEARLRGIRSRLDRLEGSFK
ncbi:MAG: hypothetical protein DRO01_01390 [Thermoproteota archaeon]|nr:MAG: hypothetical protein DRO01_01390 [Candidatus Korarchaeota archaeon]